MLFEDSFSAKLMPLRIWKRKNAMQSFSSLFINLNHNSAIKDEEDQSFNIRFCDEMTS